MPIRLRWGQEVEYPEFDVRSAVFQGLLGPEPSLDGSARPARTLRRCSRPIRAPRRADGESCRRQESRKRVTERKRKKGKRARVTDRVTVESQTRARHRQAALLALCGAKAGPREELHFV